MSEAKNLTDSSSSITKEDISAKKKGLPAHLLKGVFSPSTATSSAKKSIKGDKPNIKSFAETFLTPQASKSKNFDFMVAHEVNVEKRITSPQHISKLKETNNSNPILQNNEEPTHVFKVSLKPCSSSHKTTIFSDDGEMPLFTKKARSEFSPKRPSLFQEEEVKPFGIKMVHSPESKSHWESQKRQLKKVNTHHGTFNPITEGDPSSVQQIKVRVHDHSNSEQKKINDRRQLLVERIEAPHNNRQNNKSSFAFSYEPEAKTAPDVSERIISPIEQKYRGGDALGCLQYADAKFKEDNFAPKCNQTAYSEMKKGVADADKTFIRRKAL